MWLRHWLYIGNYLGMGSPWRCGSKDIEVQQKHLDCFVLEMKHNWGGRGEQKGKGKRRERVRMVGVLLCNLMS